MSPERWVKDSNVTPWAVAGLVSQYDSIAERGERQLEVSLRALSSVVEWDLRQWVSQQDFAQRKWRLRDG